MTHRDAPTAPAGFGVRLDDAARLESGGRLLVGGMPPRVLRLTAAGAEVVARWRAGATLSAGAGERRLARRLLDAGLAHPAPAHTAPPTTDVARPDVVIAVRDDADGLALALRSLEGFRVVVVDDGSRSPADIARCCGAEVTLIRRACSGGPAAARATGLAHTSSPLVAFVDADVADAGHALPDLVTHFDDPTVAAVAPRVRSTPGGSLLARWEQHHSPLDLGARPSPVGPGRRIGYVPTATLLARRAALDEVGGFDETLRWGEDVDLVWRLVEAGHTVRYDPTSEVMHRPRSRWRAVAAQRFAYGRSAAALGERHGAAVAPARASVHSVVVWGLAALGQGGAAALWALGNWGALTRRIAAATDAVPVAAAVAGRLTVSGHLTVGAGLGRAVSRTWAPVAVPAAALVPRLRLPLVVGVIAPPLWDWWRGARPTGPVRSVALRLGDDGAYCAGVWAGMLRRRTLRPVLPDVTDLPGSARRSVPMDAAAPGTVRADDSR